MRELEWMDKYDFFNLYRHHNIQEIDISGCKGITIEILEKLVSLSSLQTLIAKDCCETSPSIMNALYDAARNPKLNIFVD